MDSSFVSQLAGKANPEGLHMSNMADFSTPDPVAGQNVMDMTVKLHCMPTHIAVA